MDIARIIIGRKKYSVLHVCKILRVARSNQYRNKYPRPIRYRMKSDSSVLSSILAVTKRRATYGVLRVTALVNRERRSLHLNRWNVKRVERVMRMNKLILPKSGTRKEREHKGQVRTEQSNMRYCSDIFEFNCWDGGRVRVAFSLDCHDREAISFTAEARPLNHHDIIRLIDQTVTKRFGDYADKLPKPIQWLSDQGPQYTCVETKEYARDWGLEPITTPAYSPESNGMAEAFVKLFKRDYVYANELWTVDGVLRQLPSWFEDYNQNHPHSGLNYKSPLDYIQEVKLSKQLSA